MRPELYTTNYRYIRNADCGNNSISHKNTAIGYSFPENIHTNNTWDPEKVVFIYLGIYRYIRYTCVYATTINEKWESLSGNLKESKKEYMGRIGGKGEIMWSYYNLEI